MFWASVRQAYRLGVSHRLVRQEKRIIEVDDECNRLEVGVDDDDDDARTKIDACVQ